MLALKASDIVKSFPGVRALQGVDFDLEAGEVHALVGENGAGKSTLVKILTGIYQPDSGVISVGGKDLSAIHTAAAAFSLGISVVHQELHLMPHLDVATNILIGRMPPLFAGRGIDWKKTYQLAQECLDVVSAEFSPKELVKNLSISQQQLVEIAKSVSRNPRIIFMDEPTSSLMPAEINRLFEIINDLKKRGIAIVYISHKLDEIKRASDRVTILRDGKKVLTTNAQDISMDEIINVMVGGSVTERYPKQQIEIGGPLLAVKGLNSKRSKLKDISFDVKQGEIVGITGLLGAGRTELARAIFGADSVDSGEIYVDEKKVSIKKVSDAINAGMAFLTEDRKTEGLMLGLSVGENMMVSGLNCKTVTNEFLRFGFLKKRVINQNNVEHCKRLQVKTPSLLQRVMHLSGGNQQKVILGKWLTTRAKVVIFDEPTRGIDVGAKVEIYKLMQDLAREGAAIIMISSELPEVLGISDRILVMRAGRIVHELPAKTATEDIIFKYAATEVEG